MATEGHGHTPAAWTAVTIMLVGFTAGGIGVVLASTWLFIVGAAVTVLGVVAGKVMQMMGLGQTTGYHQEEAERRVGEARPEVEAQAQAQAQAQARARAQAQAQAQAQPEAEPAAQPGAAPEEDPARGPAL
jgi:nucleoid-associated protein YgaU